VYVSWGHDHGGGSNPQCLPMDPNFLTPISGNRNTHLQ